jgi:hypothetical protein
MTRVDEASSKLLTSKNKLKNITVGEITMVILLVTSMVSDVSQVSSVKEEIAKVDAKVTLVAEKLSEHIKMTKKSSLMCMGIDGSEKVISARSVR